MRIKSEETTRVMKASDCIGRFPFFGVLEPDHKDRPGCAVLRGSSAHADVFVHEKSIAVGNSLPLRNWLGRACLFAFGTDLDPDKKGSRAVSWIPVDVVAFDGAKPISEPDWHALRRTALEQHGLDAIRKLIEAKWYVDLPNGRKLRASQSAINHPVSGQLLGPLLQAAGITAASAPQPTSGQLFDPLLPGIVAKLVRRSYWGGPHFGALHAALEKSPFRGDFDAAFLAILQALATNNIPELQNRSPIDLLAVLSPKQLSELFLPDIKLIEGIKPDDRRGFAEWLLHRGAPRAQLDALLRWKLELAEIAVRLVDDPAFCPSPDTMGFLFAPWAVDHALPERVVTRACIDKDWRPLLPPNVQWRVKFADGDIGSALISCNNSCDDTAWSGLMERAALAIDLESDGIVVWQIGVAQDGRKDCLYDCNGVLGPASLDAALSELANRVSRASVVVGHNFLAWDAPILERIRTGLLYGAQIWDTLLVSCILEPARATFSLGGKHSAAEDAHDTLKLFLEQGGRIGWSTLGDVLAGNTRSSQRLLAAIAERIKELASLPSHDSTLSQLLRDASASPAKITGLAAPPAFLRRLRWQKFFRRVTAPGAPREMEIDATLLRDRLASLSTSHPAVAVIDAFARLSLDLVMQIQRSDLLPWMWETDEEIAKAVAASEVEGEARPGCVNAMLYPLDTAWYESPAFGATFFVGISGGALIALSNGSLRAGIPGTASKRPGRALVEEVANGGANGSKLNLWVIRDALSEHPTLDPSTWRRALVIRPPASQCRLDALSGPRSSLPTRLVGPPEEWLDPFAFDQRAYWAEVIRRALVAMDEASKSDSRRVGLLLVSSSISPKLVQAIELALGAADRCPAESDHRSRVESLRRASRARGSCLVATIERYGEWKELAAAAGVSLLPIVEALPLEQWVAIDQWFAISEEPASHYSSDALLDQGELDGDGADDADYEVQPTMPSDEAPPPEVSAHAFRTVDSTLVRKEAGRVLGRYLDGWLESNAFAEDEEVVILDPRLPAGTRALSTGFKMLEVDSWTPLRVDARTVAMALDVLVIRREEPSDSYDALQNFLSANWTYDDFKVETQKPVIDRIRRRDADVLVTLPTGEGKSVLFQVPALYRGGLSRRLSIVISPLRALMRDQVENLWQLGFGESVDFLSGDRAWFENEEVFQGILDHRVLLLYVAPERFRSRRFLEVLSRRWDADGGFEFLIVDEAHCVSQWGYDFRPDYFHALSVLCKNFRVSPSGEVTPFLLMSATVTAIARADLSRLIQLDVPGTAWGPLAQASEEYRHPLQSFIKIRCRSVTGSLRGPKSADWDLDSRLGIIQEVIDSLPGLSNEGDGSAVVVFVSRRDHAEEVASRLTALTGKQVDYYHAGLDAAQRESTYDDYKKGRLALLVATKAFGMGMDIPHIHAAAHLSPPMFLEDHLQEVGRIGRSHSSRERAGLSQIVATLMSSVEDFQTNASNLQESLVGEPQIKALQERIEARALPGPIDGTRIAIIDEIGGQSANHPVEHRRLATQTRRMLFWLERLQQVEIVAMVPHLVELELDQRQLSDIAKNHPHLAAIANSLCDLVSDGLATNLSGSPTGQTHSEGPLQSNRGLLNSIVEGVGRFIGFLFGRSAPLTPAPAAPVHAHKNGPVSRPMPTQRRAAVQLDALARKIAAASIDDVLSQLHELDQKMAVTILRELSFSQGRLATLAASVIDNLFQWVEIAARAIVRHASGHSDRLLDWDGLGLSEFQVAIDGRDQTAYVRPSLRRAALRLARNAGVRSRERSSDGGKFETLVSLTAVRAPLGLSRIGRLIALSRGVWTEVSSAASIGAAGVRLGRLLGATSDGQMVKYRESDLLKALNLVSALRLATTTDRLFPLSYVLQLHDQNSASSSNTATVLDELQVVNAITAVRGHAVEIFSRLPNDPPEVRDDFIRDYFEQTTAEGLEKMYETHIRNVEDSDASGWVGQKLRQIQTKSISEHFAPFVAVDAPEPEQWNVISLPYSTSALVNSGPGAGKTRVLLARIVHLIAKQGLKPQAILVLAFNRAVVFEIREKIRTIFTDLGYGAYLRNLTVSTFHSFARRHSLGAQHNNLENLLPEFASRLKTDAAFRSRVAAGYRAILIDEFQDVNESLMTILEQLHSATGAGMTAIGDDDQDILGFTRQNNNIKQSRFHFDAFANLFNAQSFVLSVNFRSTREIVQKSQEMVQAYIGGARLKAARTLRAFRDSSSGDKPERLFWLGDFEGLRNKALSIADKWLMQREEEIAILCRTNAEVEEVHSILVKQHSDIAVLSRNSDDLANLRHVGMWLDLLRDQDQARRLDGKLRSELEEAWSKIEIPEVARARGEDVDVWSFWDLACMEQAYRRVEHLVEFLSGLRFDDYIRMQGRAHQSPRRLVSTIHKVKGLEFDRVIVLPSSSSFGGGVAAAEEEARLLYVAMTRAKSSLLYCLGDREKAWAGKVPGTFASKDDGLQTTMLLGHMEESPHYFISFGALARHNAPKAQQYIEREVAIGDPVTVSEQKLIHQGTAVAQLNVNVGPNADLHVAAVRRYPQDPHGHFWRNLHPQIQRQGWSYLVLVKGRLH